MSAPAAEPRCLNCGTAAPEGVLHCARCGQRTSTRRLTLHDIGHEAWHALTHTDRGVLALLRDLCLRPGHVARSYVEGQRRRHFNPFVFLVVVVGVASAALAASGFVDFRGRAPPNAVSAFIESHLNLLILAQVPVLALLGRMFFARSGHNVAEHLVLAAYCSGMRSVFFTLVVAPLWMLTRWNYPAMVLGYLALWALYFGFACAQFHEHGTRGWRFAKGVLSALLTQGIAVAVVAAAITIAALEWSGR
jgi:Protein of unknown function (DUF3667)